MRRLGVPPWRAVVLTAAVCTAAVVSSVARVSAANPPLPCDATAGVQDYTPCSAPWTHAGPHTYVQTVDPLQISSAGAVQAVARADANGAWFAASVNGGLWRSLDIATGSAAPSWTNVLDGQPVRCVSMSAVHVVAGTTPPMVLAGCGASTSSEMGRGATVFNNGDWGGVMLSADGGDTWAMTAFPANLYVTKIESVGASQLLVATRASFYNESSGGGVWASSDRGATWKHVLSEPTFDLAVGADSKTVVATLVATEHAVAVSTDGGDSFTDWSEGVEWPSGHLPYYTTVSLSKTTAFFGGYSVDHSNLANTTSAIWSRPLSALPSSSRVDGASAAASAAAPWALIPGQPDDLDGDAMPKDRMALLADPNNDALVYAAGNGGMVAWRAEWATGHWESLIGNNTFNDTTDGSSPHVDCRGYAWEPAVAGGALLLVSDGGVFMREKPDVAGGGRWRSLNGDTSEMEMLSAHLDPNGETGRWVAGSQDNCVQVGGVGSTVPAKGFVFGDGTVTAVDNTQTPSRLYGSRQFAGAYEDDDHVRRAGESGGDDDDSDVGIGFMQGDMVVKIPIDDWFQDLSAFPYFVSPWGLNSQQPTRLQFFAEATNGNPAGFYTLEVPPSISDPGDFKPPTFDLSSGGGTVFGMIAGGFTDGASDESVLIAVNASHLYVRSAATGGELQTRPLPMRYATPVTLQYDSSGQPILGPLTHARTVFIAALPSDSSVIALTGWESIASNVGTEAVWLTRDAGHAWINITTNLVEASATLAAARPSGPIVLRYDETNATAVVLGTVTGVFVGWLDDADADGSTVSWSRLGLCADLPLVKVQSLSYEHYSDTIVAATMGRGVYTLPAKDVLLKSREQQLAGRCTVPTPVPPTDAAADTAGVVSTARLNGPLAKYFPTVV